jgi:hypothetical protein
MASYHSGDANTLIAGFGDAQECDNKCKIEEKHILSREIVLKA